MERRNGERWVPLAEVARPHGVRGEVRLRVFNKASDLLLDRDEVLVRMRDGSEHEVSVDASRRADDAILMKLHSIDDRDRADELRGALVCLRRRDFPEPEEGEFYAVDVVGAEVRLGDARIGEVAEIVTYPTTEAVVVRAEDGLGDWEVPLTESFVRAVDARAGVVVLVTLEGLERSAPKRKKAKRGAARDEEGEEG